MGSQSSHGREADKPSWPGRKRQISGSAPGLVNEVVERVPGRAGEIAIGAHEIAPDRKPLRERCCIPPAGNLRAHRLRAFEHVIANVVAHIVRKLRKMQNLDGHLSFLREVCGC